jgi:hypothetical protein
MKVSDVATKKVENIQPKITQPQTVKTNVDSPVEANPASKTGMFAFAADLAKAKLNAAANATAAANITPKEQDEIKKGVEKVFQTIGNGDGKATVELANQLRGKSPEYQAEFMKQLKDTVGVGNLEGLLRTAGGETPHFLSDARPSDSDKQVIAQALGNAFDKGALGTDFIKQTLDWESKRIPAGNDYLGELIGKSGSRGLKEAFFDESMKMYNPKNSGYFPDTSSFISGAAKAIAGDPTLLQSKLSELNKKGELETFIKGLDPKKFNVPYYEEQNNALSKIVAGAAKIQPPTAEVLQLFKTTANNFMGGDYNDRFGMADAMTKLYTGGTTTYSPTGGAYQTNSNAEVFLMELSKYGNGADGTSVLALGKFFANTAFNDKFKDHDAVMSITQREMKKLQSAVLDYPNVDAQTKKLIESSTQLDPNSTESSTSQTQQQLAYRLGRITSSVFRGFEEAVQNRNAGNAAKDKMVDFLFSIIPVGKLSEAAGKVPGVGSLAGKATDKAVDIAKEKLKEWLHDQDLNENRRGVFDTLANIAGTLPPYLYDDFKNGYGEVIDMVNDLKNK